MGPWRHGGWSRTSGGQLGNIKFGAPTAEHYREHIELAFFNYHLKGQGTLTLPEASVFDTGRLQWHDFDEWPPADAREAELVLGPDLSLSFDPAASADAGFHEYVSDPAKPVPFSEAISRGMTREYMTDDQRFAARRPDVLAFQTDVLDADVTVVGPVVADLWVSTSGTASGWSS
jgi:putative CocE/NonD family hydrolase